jgi:hypothetical protein
LKKKCNKHSKEEFYIIRMMTSGRMREVGHVARTGDMRNAYRKPAGYRSLGDKGLNERIILKESVDWIHQTNNRDK